MLATEKPARAMTHFDHLQRHLPDLMKRNILDIGAGRGKFVIDAAERGAAVVGLEPHSAYRDEIGKRAAERNLAVRVIPGSGEKLPFPDGSFGFANVSEVIEHVEEPEKVAREVFRVLKAGGAAYVSVPNRFGFKDQHFHLYFVNWLPRVWADAFISLFGRHKDYRSAAGRQRLADMHYMTYPAARRLFLIAGFSVTDMRETRIRGVAGFFTPLALAAYGLLRAFYFDSFHLLLTKESRGPRATMV
ncbi:MAG: class I SAM-dependent methyltransferase [Patescibacteria group bacterium]